MNKLIFKTTLNPNAKEWRPSPSPPPPPLPQPPHHVYHPSTSLPPSQPPVQVVAPTLTKQRFCYRNRNIPPRFRNATSTASNKTPPPPQKQVWVKKGKKVVSGDSGGTTVSSETPTSSFTTVMIKNIPNKIRRGYMLEFLDGFCKIHTLEYDFLYLPMDFRKNNNLGYAFVNFTTVEAALKFKRILQDYEWKEKILSQKICDITWARVQGKEALIRRFQNSNFTCDTLEFLPVVLDPPRNGSDPNPPRPLIVGRLHRGRN